MVTMDNCVLRIVAVKGAVIGGTGAPALVERCLQLSGKALVKLEPLRDSCCVNLAHV